MPTCYRRAITMQVYYSKESSFRCCTYILLCYQALLLQPRTSFILCLTSSLILSLAGPRYFLGSKSPGFSAKCSLIPAVIASLRSESILILQTAILAAFLSISSGTPLAPGMSPPYLLMVSTNSGITDDAPCRTMGYPGSL